MLVRAVYVLLCVVVSVSLARWAGRSLGAPGDASVDMIAAVVSAHVVLFTVPASRIAEFKSALQLTCITLVVFGLASVVGWRELGANGLPVQIAWVGAIALGFYLRRFGPGGFRLGMLLSIMFMFVVILNPTRAMAEWWLLSAAIGGATAAVVLLIAWRPSAQAAFRRELDDFLEMAASILREPMAKCHSDAHCNSMLPKWRRLARTAELVGHVLPEYKKHTERVLVQALRFSLAIEVIFDRPVRAAERQDTDQTLLQALSVTTEALSAKDAQDNRVERGLAQLARLRDAIIVDRKRSGPERFRDARLVVGLSRAVSNYKALVAERANSAVMPSGAGTGLKHAKPDSQSGDLRFGLRLATQALIAAGLTVMIGHVLHLSHSYWATLTVMIVIGSSVGATIRRTVARILGTIAGVCCAIGVLLLADGNPKVLIPLCVLAFLPVPALMQRYYVVASALIGFTVVTLLHVVQGLSDAQMLARVYDTAIGAAVGATVSILVFPLRSASGLEKEVQAFLDQCRAALDSSVAELAQAVSEVELQKHVNALNTAISEVQSEHLVTGGLNSGNRQIQVFFGTIAVYVSLIAPSLAQLRTADIPDIDKTLVDDLNRRLKDGLRLLSCGKPCSDNLSDLTTRWRTTAELDEKISPQDAVRLVEAFVFGRKLLEAFDGLSALLLRSGLRFSNRNHNDET
ncbi:MAG: FUSC family protein [Pseudomonadota bacterium]